MRGRSIFAVASAGALALGVAACGGSSSSSGSSAGKVSGSTLTIYSSLPLQGTSHDQSQAVINGATTSSSFPRSGRSTALVAR